MTKTSICDGKEPDYESSEMQRNGQLLQIPGTSLLAGTLLILKQVSDHSSGHVPLDMMAPERVTAPMQVSHEGR